VLINKTASHQLLEKNLEGRHGFGCLGEQGRTKTERQTGRGWVGGGGDCSAIPLQVYMRTVIARIGWRVHIRTRALGQSAIENLGEKQNAFESACSGKGHRLAGPNILLSEVRDTGNAERQIGPKEEGLGG